MCWEGGERDIWGKLAIYVSYAIALPKVSENQILFFYSIYVATYFLYYICVGFFF